MSRAESNQLIGHQYRAAGDVDDSRGQRHGAVGLVAGDEHCDARVRRLLDDGVQVVATGSIEPGVRLVEQPQGGSADDEAGERCTPLLTGGQPAHRDGGQPAAQTQPFEGGQPLVVGRPDRRPPEVDVLPDREVEVQPVAVAEHADERTDPVSLGGQIAAEHDPPTPHQRYQSCTESEQRGLAGAVGAPQPHDLAAVDGQRDAGDGGKATEHRNDTVEVDHHRCSEAAPPHPIGALRRP